MTSICGDRSLNKLPNKIEWKTQSSTKDSRRRRTGSSRRHRDLDLELLAVRSEAEMDVDHPPGIELAPNPIHAPPARHGNKQMQERSRSASKCLVEAA